MCIYIFIYIHVVRYCTNNYILYIDLFCFFTFFLHACANLKDNSAAGDFRNRIVESNQFGRNFAELFNPGSKRLPLYFNTTTSTRKLYTILNSSEGSDFHTARSTSAARSLNALVDCQHNAQVALLACLAPNVPKALGVVGWLSSKESLCQFLVVGTAVNFVRF